MMGAVWDAIRDHYESAIMVFTFLLAVAVHVRQWRWQTQQEARRRQERAEDQALIRAQTTPKVYVEFVFINLDHPATGAPTWFLIVQVTNTDQVPLSVEGFPMFFVEGRDDTVLFLPSRHWVQLPPEQEGGSRHLTPSQVYRILIPCTLVAEAGRQRGLEGEIPLSVGIRTTHQEFAKSTPKHFSFSTDWAGRPALRL